MIKKLLSNEVFRNFSFLTIGSVIGQIISLFTVLRITAILSPENYGLYTFLISQGLLLVKVGNLGNNNIVIRTIARDQSKTKNYLVNNSLLKVFSILALSILYVIYNMFYGSLSSGQLSLIFLFSLLNCFSYLFEWIFTGSQKMLPVAVINLLYNFIWFCVVFFAPLEEISMTKLFVLYIAVNTLKCALLYVLLWQGKLIKGTIEKFSTATKSLMQESWPYFLMLVIMLPLTSLTNNFLDINSDEAQIGYFNLAQRFIGPVGLVITMMLTALFPNLAALWVNDANKFKKYVGHGFRLYMLISAFGCFAFTLFSEELIKMLFNESYYNSIIVCQIQVWYVFLTSIDSLIGAILGATNREKLILRLGVVYFIVCTPSLFYGSYFGAQGLSWAYVVSFGVCLIYSWFLFQKKLRLKIEKEFETISIVIVLALLSFISVMYLDFLYKSIVFLLVLVVFSIVGQRMYKKFNAL